MQLLPADKSAAADVFFDADYGYSDEDIQRNREELEKLTLEEMTARFGGAPKPETVDDNNNDGDNNNDPAPTADEIRQEQERRIRIERQQRRRRY